MHSVTCKFFNSTRGCRRGGECPFIHRVARRASPPPPCRVTVAEDELHLGFDTHVHLLEEDDDQKCRGRPPRTTRTRDKWVVRTKPVPALPTEMWDRIIAHCDAESLAAVCRVCKAMRRTALPRCTSLRAVKLSQGKIADTLRYICSNFPHLTSLSLVEGDLDGFSFENARSTLFPENLLHLSMENSRGLNDDQGASPENASRKQCKLTDIVGDLVKALCRELPRLRHLDLSNCYELSNQILNYLPTTLTILNLCGVQDINANALRLLPNLKNLEILDLQACWRLGSLYSQQNPFITSKPYCSYFSSFTITTYSPFSYLQYLPRLHTLSLSRIYCLVDNDIAALPRRLRVLDVSFCLHITDGVCRLLPSSLTEFYCQGCDYITFDSPSQDERKREEETAEGLGPQSGDSSVASLEPPASSVRPSQQQNVPRFKLRPKLRIIRGEWSLPERCCGPI